VTCTHKLAKQIPYFALPVPNYKLSTLIKHLVPFDSSSSSVTGSSVESIIDQASDRNQLQQVQQQANKNSANEMSSQANTTSQSTLPIELEPQTKPQEEQPKQQPPQQPTSNNAEIDDLSNAIASQLQISKEDELVLAQKDHLQSTIDWSQRPISETAMKYACNDVIFLSFLYPRLLELLEKHVLVDSHYDEISQIEERMKQMELQWKQMESEKELLTERLKNAMLAQNVKESKYFKLSSFEKETHFAPFHVIAQLAAKHKVVVKQPIMITNRIQEEFATQNASQEIYNLMMNKSLVNRQVSTVHRLYPKKTFTMTKNSENSCDDNASTASSSQLDDDGDDEDSSSIPQ